MLRRAFFLYILQSGQGAGLTGGNDSAVASSLLRWANYDRQRDGTTFPPPGADEGSAHTIGNAVPAIRTTNSFFFSSRPTFLVDSWGTPRGGALADVTEGNGLEVYNYDIPRNFVSRTL